MLPSRMSRQQKLIIIVSILASFITFLDGSIVNVALPAIKRDLGGGLAVQQWVVNAYLLTLGSFILLAGSLSDLFGRKKILAGGLVGFAVASVLCAVAPSGLFLVLSRAAQGIAGAMIVPSSLALIMSNFTGPEKGRAIGIWTGWTGISFIVGPVLGGLLVDMGSWRWVFAINILPICITLGLLTMLKKDKAPGGQPKIDWRGALLGVVALGGPVYALIEQPRYGWGSPLVYVPFLFGILAGVLFVWHERRTSAPMLPLKLFRNKNFSVGNLATVAIYAGLSIATFLVVIFVQQVSGYGALKAGFTLIPITLLMFFLSGQFGRLAGTHGPRLFMAIGPLIGSIGFLLMLRVTEQLNYWTQLFPAVVVFGLGLSMTVAPLTTAILGSIETDLSGIASAVNNAIARVAGLVAIALIGLVTGPVLDVDGFRRGVLVIAFLLIAGGVISALGIQNKAVSARK